MNPAESCRQFAENRKDLLGQLERQLCPEGGTLRLLDPDRSVVWPEGVRSADSPAAAILEIPLQPYGTLQLCGTEGAPSAAAGGGTSHVTWAGAVGDLLVSGMEAESELDQLVDDHMATTNQLLALYKIINRTRETWELPAKMEAVVDEAARQCSAGQAVLMLTDDVWPLCIRRGRAGEAQSRACVLAGDLGAGGKARLDAADQSVAAPILCGGETAGWLLVTEPPEGGYKAKDLKLVKALSELAGGFLSTAHLQEQVIASTRLEQEIEIASRIQALLLSRDLPECPGLALTAACRPAFHIGGDFYAAMRRPDGDLVFAFGDVAGKGVPAALFMAMTRTVLRTLSQFQGDPMTILRDVNEALYQDLERAGKFVTLVVGRYHRDGGKIDLANAGHSPVIVLTDLDAEPVLVAPQLPPVGVVPELDAVSDSWTLGVGGLIGILSDGLSEARSPAGEFFGTDRLRALLREGARAGVGKLEESIFAAVGEHSAGLPRGDDQTLLLLQRRAE